MMNHSQTRFLSSLVITAAHLAFLTCLLSCQGWAGSDSREQPLATSQQSKSQATSTKVAFAKAAGPTVVREGDVPVDEQNFRPLLIAKSGNDKGLLVGVWEPTPGAAEGQADFLTAAHPLYFLLSGGLSDSDSQSLSFLIDGDRALVFNIKSSIVAKNTKLLVVCEASLKTPTECIPQSPLFDNIDRILGVSVFHPRLAVFGSLIRLGDERQIANGEGTMWLLSELYRDELKDRPYYMGFIKLKPSANISEHVHELSTEILYVESGTATLTIDGQTINMAPNMAVHIPKGKRHSIQVTGNEPFSTVQIYSPNGPELSFKESN